MENSLRSEIQDMVRFIHGGKSTVSDSTRLWHDLRISGDDAYELLEMVHKRFGTRFDAFDFNAYFPGETDIFEGLISMIAAWFRRSDGRREFTFGHLVAIVERGVWFQP